LTLSPDYSLLSVGTTVAVSVNGALLNASTTGVLVAGQSTSQLRVANGDLIGSKSCVFARGKCQFGSGPNNNAFAVAAAPGSAISIMGSAQLAQSVGSSSATKSQLQSSPLLIPVRSCVAGEQTLSDECTACPVGTFSVKLAKSDIRVCQSCPDGLFSDTVNASACKLCPDGYECTTSKATLCLNRAYRVNSGANVTGQCTLCPADSVADTSRTRCLCDPGFYMVTDPTSSRADKLKCQICPDGADCAKAGTTIRSVLPLPGFWPEMRGTNTSFIRCINKACVGGAKTCAINYRGNLCSLCEPGFSRDSSYECQPCPSPSMTFAQSMIIAILAVLICASVIYVTLRSTEAEIEEDEQRQRDLMEREKQRKQRRLQRIDQLAKQRAQVNLLKQEREEQRESVNAQSDDSDFKMKEIHQLDEIDQKELAQDAENGENDLPDFSILVKIFTSYLQVNSLAASFAFSV
jgi:hypothetical protein